MNEWVWLLWEIIGPVVAIAVGLTMSSGSFCWMGLHRWFDIQGADIDYVANRVYPHYLRRDCGSCGLSKMVKPGSRYWRKHWRVQRDFMRTHKWIDHRAAALMDDGFEIDIVTGAPTNCDFPAAVEGLDSH